MKKIKIITDSTAYIGKEYAEENDITVVPLNYSFGDSRDKEGYPGEFESFYQQLQTSKLFPTTSQPSVGEFLEEFKQAFKDGYEEIIAILLSSKLSGTYNSGVLARGILGDERISIIDSQQSASNLRFLVEDAINMVRDGKSKKEIVDHLEKKKDTMHVYLTVETLEYLKKGGRLSTLESAIGSMLNIKPIIELKDGELSSTDKTRGKNKALNMMISKIPQDVEKISVCYILNLQEAEKVRDKLKDKFPQAKISLDELGPVIGCHLGAGGIGLCFY